MRRSEGICAVLVGRPRRKSYPRTTGHIAQVSNGPSCAVYLIVLIVIYLVKHHTNTRLPPSVLAASRLDHAAPRLKSLVILTRGDDELVVGDLRRRV